MKVWLATIVLCFAVDPVPVGTVDVWPVAAGRSAIVARQRAPDLGRLAFLVSLPVAYACLYQLGFQHTSARVLVHSILGCLFYGAFAAKVLIVRSRDLPRQRSAARRRARVRRACLSLAAERALVHRPFGLPVALMLRLLDRGLAVVSWTAAALVVVLLFAGSEPDRRQEVRRGWERPRRGRGRAHPGRPCSRAPGAVTATRSRRRARAARSARTSISCDQAPRASAQIVRSGGGVMPSFAGKLSDAQIAAVASYVSSVAGR